MFNVCLTTLRNIGGLCCANAIAQLTEKLQQAAMDLGDLNSTVVDESVDLVAATAAVNTAYSRASEELAAQSKLLLTAMPKVVAYRELSPEFDELTPPEVAMAVRQFLTELDLLAQLDGVEPLSIAEGVAIEQYLRESIRIIASLTNELKTTIS